MAWLTPSRPSRALPARARLRVEALESRLTPSVAPTDLLPPPETTTTTAGATIATAPAETQSQLILAVQQWDAQTGANVGTTASAGSTTPTAGVTVTATGQGTTASFTGTTYYDDLNDEGDPLGDETPVATTGGEQFFP